MNVSNDATKAAIIVFLNKSALTLSARQCTIDDLAELAANPKVHSCKDVMPLIKLATFGDLKSPRGCLRTDKNLLAITGIEGDYDGGKMPMLEAAAHIQDAGIEAVLYTSARHTVEKPRWRVLCLLSKPYPVEERYKFVARLNGVLDGILGDESFTPSQGFFFGQVKGTTYDHAQTSGAFIDLLSGLDERAIFDADDGSIFNAALQIGKANGNGATPPCRGVSKQITAPVVYPGPPQDITKVGEALARIDPNIAYDDWLRIGMALHQTCWVESFPLWDEWSSSGEDYPGIDALRDKWSGFNKDGQVGLGTIYHFADSAICTSTSTAAGPTGDSLSVLRADAILPKAIDWLWHGYLARSMFHVMAGRAGTGKTTLALSMAATISSGGKWPDGTRAKLGVVVMWTGEDAIAQTLIPRLKAMGADLRNIHFIDAVNMEDGRRSFDPATDIDLLDQKLARIPNVQLLIIDPIVSAVTASSGENGSTRRDLQPFVDLGNRRNCTLLGITHFSKGTKGRDPLERVTGSLAYGAFARVVFGTGKAAEEGDPNVFARIKSNIGPDGGGFEYDIAIDDMGGGIVGSRIQWGKALDGHASDLLAACEADDFNFERDDAAGWLKTELKDGPVSVKELQRLARDAGHTWTTVKRAKKELRVQSEKSAFQGGWRWYLPVEICIPRSHGPAEGGHSQLGDPLRDGKQPKPAPGNTLTEGDQGTDQGDPLRAQGDQVMEGVVPFGGSPATTSFEADPPPEGDHLRESDPLRENVERF